MGTGDEKHMGFHLGGLQTEENRRMRLLTYIAATAVLLGLSWSQWSFAQERCGDIAFSADINNRFPNARNACVGIVERGGKPYAHFQARIVAVRGNTVEAQFKAPDGTYSKTIAFTPPSDARVKIQGRSYRYGELTRGQELDVYLPPDRWEIEVARDADPNVDFLTAQQVEPVPLTEPTTQLAAALPATAGALPFLALLGTLLLLWGGGLAALDAWLVRLRAASGERK
jgi:hypothetical protein